jgi:histone acetyltransferase MYST1
MDEWINVSRIVSPPSVGNAKARALKRETEKKRKQQELAAAAAAVAAAAGPRSRRRSSAVPFAIEEGGDSRRTRLRRKSSVIGDGMEADDATILASNSIEEEEEPASFEKEKTKNVEILTSDLGVVTTQVGEHFLATVQAQELDEHEGLDEASLREHEEVTKIKNVGFLELGRHQMETWYFSPLPKELINGNSVGSNRDNNTPGFLEILYVCEFTFRMFARKKELQSYQKTIRPQSRHPPGNEIYRNGNLSMFEVDGLEEKIYCQNLCYIAKLFLDHKTLYFDVDPFLFYVLCEIDERGYHPVGYFSKEKYSDVGYNLACILSFPAHQRKGYGRFLIAFSYELTKKEEKVGSPGKELLIRTNFELLLPHCFDFSYVVFVLFVNPEKPMSDLGQQAYKPYWASTIIDFLLNQSHESALSIMDISKRTSIMAEDIVYTLNQLGILKIINGAYFIAAERNLLMQLSSKYPIKEPRVDPTKLHWTPFLTDNKRDKFSIHSKKPSIEAEGSGISSTGVVGYPDKSQPITTCFR